MTVEQTPRRAATTTSRTTKATKGSEAERATVRDAGRAAARVSKALELAVGERNLSLPQYRLLAFLSGGPERATELASWLEVSPPSLTALVDGLVHKGLVERVTSTEDRRCVRHVLTPAGAASLDGGDDAIAERLTEVLAFLTAEEARQVVTGLGLLGEAMQRSRDAQKDELDQIEKEAKEAKEAGKARVKAAAKEGDKEVTPAR